ncbi:hypothetical protein RaK2_00289 [Klebsiella phage vB_KleM_RaK2]|uniref:Uncharacterized protein n=1 Tax=Klebsiella phage vB_KleM_RaK2 TaxID=1147094 RepID=H6X496_9CAUD|nr:hypothetical protein F403_gp246 [Klebsiella phage vB_KleM_RaK2]AFA44562.1 hypothetical protein RaK2_00289 [Klebsiella phage vB_KleM_RaK2]
MFQKETVLKKIDECIDTLQYHISESNSSTEILDHTSILNKKKKKNYKLILSALEEIKSGNRNELHGICNNLYFKMDNTDMVEEFIKYSFDRIYGSNHDYPIEGSRFHYQMNKNKWDESTIHGKNRLNLLDSMIQYCKCRLLSI